MDDMRELTKRNITSTEEVHTTIFDFYTLATSNLVISLAEDIGDCQSKNNWQLVMTYFHMIQVKKYLFKFKMSSVVYIEKKNL